MFKPLITALLIIAALSSCSSLKPIQSGTNQVATPVPTPSSAKSKEVRFLDDISVTANSEKSIVDTRKESTRKESVDNKANEMQKAAAIEKASSLQLKYAVLLNTDVELLTNTRLLSFVDDWYGTRYRMGGTTKSGIDCSAFVQAIYLSAFAVTLPRTARDQYRYSRIISATELKEGDLVFFNTRGGISHVGIYLQNNKFVHASSSNGVVISDMFEPYYLKRYMGAGRIEKNSDITTNP